MKKNRVFLFVAIAAIMCFTEFTSGATKASTDASITESVTAEDEDEFSYPMNKTNVTLRVWTSNMVLSQEYAEYQQSPFHVGLGEKTGVNLAWEFPVAGASADESFNLSIASGDLPDIYMCGIGAKGQTLIDDGYIISLNDVIEQYSPNFKKYMQENSGYEKAMKTDNGTIFMYPFMRENESLLTFVGPIARKDWLEEQGLSIPSTIAEWETILEVFAKEYDAKFLFNAASANRMGVFGPWMAYGAIRDFYNEDGQIVYGAALPEYKLGMELMNKWFENGLIDPDFVTMDNNGLKTKVLSNKVGLTFTATSELSVFITDSAASGNPQDWIAIPYPKLNESDEIEFIQMSAMPDGNGAAITSACKDIETAARFLDYGFSTEGNLYWNYGEEGVSYTVVDGVPTYTELVTEDPIGMTDALRKYIGMINGGIGTQEFNMWRQRNTQAAVDGVKLWTQKNNMINHLLPMLTPTTEEASEMSMLENAIRTYSDEMFYKFILGEESLDNFDTYLQTLEKMKLDRVLEIKQSQYDRYLNR